MKLPTHSVYCIISHMRACDKQLIISHPLAEMKYAHFEKKKFVVVKIKTRKFLPVFLLFIFRLNCFIHKRNFSLFFLIFIYPHTSKKRNNNNIFIFFREYMRKKMQGSRRQRQSEFYTHVYRVKVHEKYLYSYYVETHHYVDSFSSS